MFFQLPVGTIWRFRLGSGEFGCLCSSFLFWLFSSATSSATQTTGGRPRVKTTFVMTSWLCDVISFCVFTEEEIADQVKQLQAEEAVRQMGLFNPYAETWASYNVNAFTLNRSHIKFQSKILQNSFLKSLAFSVLYFVLSLNEVFSIVSR